MDKIVAIEKNPLVERLTTRLVQEGLVSETQMAEAKRAQKQTDKSLGKILVELRILSQEDFLAFIADQLGIPHINLSKYMIESEVIDLVPEAVARKYKLIPIFQVRDALTVAMDDPTNVLALDDIRFQTGMEINPVLASNESIKKAIDQHYGGTRLIDQTIKGLEVTSYGVETAEDLEAEQLQKITEQAPIIKLVNQLILEAIRDKASDIHLEQQKQSMKTRYRIDGMLHDVSTIPKSMRLAVVSRIKIMADLDIAERRLPKDGRIQISLGAREIDLRISTFPTIYGEKLVLRILDKGKNPLDLSELGLSTENLQRFRMLVGKPNGLILITGPTGCGKTSTLYAALRTVNSRERNIITLEDPVEYEIADINQGQVNPQAGLTFASGLRSILRQDPDIIMVGEIRDLETAELVTRAALTGHLVFSTMHTMDAPGAITRLIDIGVEPFLIRSNVIGIIAQRLVRKICPHCKERYSPPASLLEEAGWANKKDLELYKGKGCKQCRHTGYKGRIGVFEVLVLNENIQELITSKSPTSRITQAARQSGVKSMFEDGLEKIAAGITTIEEVLRQTKSEY